MNGVREVKMTVRESEQEYRMNCNINRKIYNNKKYNIIN